MELYFTRHGKTEWNQEMRFQGMMGDSPLLPASYEEIKKLGHELRNIPFEKVYVSTSKRAQDTAKGIIAELNRPAELKTDANLRELGLGDLEGQPIEEMRKIYQTNLDNLRHQLDRYDPTPFHGEPIGVAIERIVSVVRQAILDNKTGAPLLFVGHGASLTASIQYMAGKELAELRSQGGLFNNSLSVLETDSTTLPYKMVKWNDVSFLGKDNGETLDSII
jgi:probable phosphoglycerate mutase